MRDIKRFIEDIKKFYNYAVYAGKAELKSEIANSHLSWLWWILDPLLFMFVYAFVALVVFGRGEQFFLVYVFIGLTTWQFFEKTVKASVKIVSANSSVVSKVYIPKYILILIRMCSNGFKMMVSFSLVVVLMLIYWVPVSFRILYAVPILLTMLIFTFGVSCFLLHFGVFVEDLANLVNVGLKLLFYMTGIFYNIENRLDGAYKFILLKCNPVAFLISDLRKCVIYCENPDFGFLFFWFVVSCIIAVGGVKVIYNNENSYVKVI